MARSSQRLVMLAAAVVLAALITGLTIGVSRVGSSRSIQDINEDSSCFKGEALRPTAEATSGADATADIGGEVYTQADFVSVLKNQGLDVEGFSEVNQPFLSRTGSALNLRGYDQFKHALNVFVYPDAPSRIEDSSWLGDDLSRSLPLIDWIAPPYVYARGNLLVILVTSDDQLVTSVRAAMAALP